MAAKSTNPRLNIHSMVEDILKYLWVMVLGALAVTMMMDLRMTEFSKKTYTTKATFIVTSKSYSNYSYNNLSAATSMASTLQNILNSDILKKEVCKDIGIETFDAQVSAKVVKETNLLELYVTSSTPIRSFQIIRSIMNNYQNLTQYVNQEAFMQVLEEPYVPSSASGGARNKGRLRQIFVVSFGVLLLLFMYLSYNNDSIKSEEDQSEKLDAKALGAIRNEKRKLFVKNSSPLVNDVNVSFEFTEQHKKMASRLINAAADADARTIMITSINEHEGKSNVCANLALTLARQNYKVLLMDCDFRRPTQYKLFKVDEFTEFVKVLKNKAEIPQAIIHKDGVDLLLNKKQYANSTELVSSAEMKDALTRIRKNYHYVIVDTPPMGSMSDAEAIADITDMSVLVVRYNSDLAGDINDAIDELNRADSTFGGTVLNGLRESTIVSGNAGYGGYGAYGRYGKYGKYGKYGRYGHYAQKRSSSGVKA